jgi:hypothetical protein
MKWVMAVTKDLSRELLQKVPNFVGIFCHFSWQESCFPELVFTVLIEQILDWIYEIAVHSRVFILDVPLI